MIDGVSTDSLDADLAVSATAHAIPLVSVVKREASCMTTETSWTIGRSIDPHEMITQRGALDTGRCLFGREGCCHITVPAVARLILAKQPSDFEAGTPAAVWPSLMATSDAVKHTVGPCRTVAALEPCLPARPRC